MRKKIFFVLFFLTLIFTRFYNLEHTARFTEDESGFLVRVHQIFVERKITLVGQVNETGTKVFSSLSVYMLLPFAVLGKFDPASVFYGAAFWGVVTGLALLYIVKIVNPKLLIISSLLILFLFPLVQTCMWAWNPNFIPLWIGLGILCYLQKKDIFYFFTGLFFGLSVHQHYYALFGVAFFSFIISIEAFLNKNFKKTFYLGFGIFLTLLPFIIFDLRHSPGIFLLGASGQAQTFQISQISKNLPTFTFETFKYYTQSNVFAVFLLISTVLGLWHDVVNKSKALIFILPGIFQISAISALGSYYPHYLFPVIVFYFVYLIYPRQKFGRVVSLSSIILLVIGGIISFIPLSRNAPVGPDLTTVKKIDWVLEERISRGDIKNVNIAVLGSVDNNTYGRKYRDLLLVPNNYTLSSSDDYSKSDYLFVVSTQEEEKVRTDPSHDMQNFRNGSLLGKWEVDSGGWVVYLFGKGS